MSFVTAISRHARSSVLLAAFVLAACGPKDADIRTGVDAALAATPAVTASVASGVVTLSGEFADEATRTATEAKVKDVKGVKSVVNSATITPPPPPPVVMSPDDSLLTNVGVALQEFPTLSASVADGVVTLTGEIGRVELPKVMQALSALNPRKIDNKATVTR